MVAVYGGGPTRCARPSAVGTTRPAGGGTGSPGFAVFLGLGLVGGGAYLRVPVAAVAGAAPAVTGLALAGTGLSAATGGGLGGATQTGVQLFDVLVRILANTVSIARLAAFGLTRAALGQVVWHGTAALPGRGPWALVGAVLVFVAGNALAFALEGLVAGVQALAAARPTFGG